MLSIESIHHVVNAALSGIATLNGQLEAAPTPAQSESPNAMLADIAEAERQLSQGAAVIAAEFAAVQASLEQRAQIVRNQLKDQAMDSLESLVRTGAVSLDEVLRRLGVPTGVAHKSGSTKEKGHRGTAVGESGQTKAQTIPGAVKYRNAQTGESWTGRGPRPQWIKQLLAAGEDLEAYRADRRADQPMNAGQQPATPAEAEPVKSAPMAAWPDSRQERAPGEADSITPSASAAGATAPAAGADHAEVDQATPGAGVGASSADDIGDAIQFDGDFDGDLNGGAAGAATDSDIGDMLSELGRTGTQNDDGNA